MLHNVTRIAEVFLELRQAGNVEHFGSVLTFSCAQYYGAEKSPVFNKEVGDEIVKFLRGHAKQMEASLRDWETKIQIARSKYYQLNYYTTLQLLTLRREFGQYKGTHLSGVSPNILPLLQSVSLNIKDSAVNDAVLAATTEEPSPKCSSDTADLTDKVSPARHIIISSSARLSPVSLISEGSESNPPQSPSKMSSVSNISTPNTSVILSLPPSVDKMTLTDEQQEIFTHCVTFYNFPKHLVLRAFQECVPNTKRYDILRWCEGNAKNCSDVGYRESEFEPEEDDVQSSSSESSDESDNGDVFTSTDPISTSGMSA